MVFWGKNRKKANFFSYIAILFIIAVLGLIAFFTIKQISADTSGGNVTIKLSVNRDANKIITAKIPERYNVTLFSGKNQITEAGKVTGTQGNLVFPVSDFSKNYEFRIASSSIYAIPPGFTKSAGQVVSGTTPSLKLGNGATYQINLTVGNTTSATATISKVESAGTKAAPAAAPASIGSGGADPHVCVSLNSTFVWLQQSEYNQLKTSGKSVSIVDESNCGQKPTVVISDPYVCVSLNSTFVWLQKSEYDRLQESRKNVALISDEKKCGTKPVAANALATNADGTTVLDVKTVDNSGNPVAGATVSISVTKTDPVVKQLDSLWSNEFKINHQTGTDGIYKFQWVSEKFVYKDPTNPSAAETKLNSATLEIKAQSKDTQVVSATTDVLSGKSSEVTIILPIGAKENAAVNKKVLQAPVTEVKPQGEKSDFPAGDNSIEFRPVRYSEAGFADQKAPIGAVNYTLEVETTVLSEKDKPETATASSLTAYAESSTTLSSKVCMPLGDTTKITYDLLGNSNILKREGTNGPEYLYAQNLKSVGQTGAPIGSAVRALDPQNDNKEYNGIWGPCLASGSGVGTQTSAGADSGSSATGQTSSAAANTGQGAITDTPELVKGESNLKQEKNWIGSIGEEISSKAKDLSNFVANLVKPKEKEIYRYNFSSRTIDNGVNSKIRITGLPDGKYTLTVSKANFEENKFIPEKEITGNVSFGDIYLVAAPGAEPPSAPTSSEEIISNIREDGNKIIHEIKVGNEILGYVSSAAGYGWQKKDSDGKYKTGQPEFAKNSGVPQAAVSESNTGSSNVVTGTKKCLQEKNINPPKYFWVTLGSDGKTWSGPGWSQLFIDGNTVNNMSLEVVKDSLCK